MNTTSVSGSITMRPRFLASRRMMSTKAQSRTGDPGTAKAILIGGPGKARTELAGYLNDKHPALAKRIWAIEPMDHPSDAELVAAARKYFHAATRMHQ